MRVPRLPLAPLVRDEQGNILPIAAAGILVMSALIGSAVDMSRAYQIQTRLQNACDAGVLAGRRAITNQGFTSAAEAQALRYFNVNYDENAQGSDNTTISFEGDNAGNTVTGQASTTMPMLIMQLFGKNDMTITATCTSTMGVGNSDVTMVLDVTGSMGSALSGGTRLSALKTAMINFYDTVDTATAGSNARIRYAIVPFSSTVNVGRLLTGLNEDYIVDEWTIQSRAPVFNTITEQVRVGWNTPVITSNTNFSSVTNSSTVQLNSTNYSSQTSCNAALPANTAWTNNGAPTTSTGTTTNGSGQQVVTTTTAQPQRMTTYLCQRSGSRWRRFYYESYRTFYSYQYATSDPIMETRTRTEFSNWVYRPVTYDVSELKRFNAVSTPTGENGTAESSTWDGCIEERETVAASTFSFNGLTGMTPADALDMDIDRIPDADDATKWAPLWRQVAYLRNSTPSGTSLYGSLASSQCVPEARALDEMDRTSFTAYVNALTAQGGTYLSIGMLWGARLASPDGIYRDVVREEPANGANVNRHVIFMTDGLQEASTTIYHAYGIERLDQRVTGSSGTSVQNARHLSRFRAICDAVKAKGIRVWVIAFTTGLNSDLSYCASPSSSFTANDASQLNAAFQEIAKQVGELRVLQ